MTQTPTALQLWQEFRHHLVTEITVDTPDTAPDAKATLTITIKNTAPTEENHPRILFFDVRVETKGRATPHSRFPSGDFQIAPGDQRDFLYDIRYAEIPAFSATVTAQVSRRELFKITTTATPPPEHTQPAIRNYLNEKVVSEAQSHLSEIFKSSMEWLPDANTTIADMPAKLEHLDRVVEAIKTFDKDFRAAKGPFAATKDNPVYAAFAGVAGPALRNLDLLKTAANNNDLQALTTATNKLTATTENLSAIGEAISTLKATHNID